MYPFIHLGPLTLGTYGLMVATGLICAFFVMRADIRRRALQVDSEIVSGITGRAVLEGARDYHLLESPAEFFANPLPLLFSTTGFAWFGALIGGFTALVLLARSYRMKILLMLDVASPAAALGYGIGRIGCLISGDGDYGTPTSLPWGMSFPNGLVPTTDRVHPTPIYEFLAALAIAYFLWRIGSRAIADAPVAQEASHPAGEVFAW
jgi:phosphatidylglycerol:prolipoprotein diacylglycerol transferase